jgi:hypothetical protein
VNNENIENIEINVNIAINENMENIENNENNVNIDDIIKNIRNYIETLNQYKQKINEITVVNQIKKLKWQRYYIQLKSDLKEDDIPDIDKPHLTLIEFFIKSNGNDKSKDANDIKNYLFNKGEIAKIILNLLKDNDVEFSLKEYSKLGHNNLPVAVLQINSKNNIYKDFYSLVNEIRNEMIKIFWDKYTFKTDNYPYPIQPNTITRYGFYHKKTKLFDEINVKSTGNYIILTDKENEVKILIRSYLGEETPHITLPNTVSDPPTFEPDIFKMANWEYNYTTSKKTKIDTTIPIVGYHPNKNMNTNI